MIPPVLEFLSFGNQQGQVKCLKFKVPKVKGTKVTITCFGPVFIASKMGFPMQ
jgi:hypothetical protein